MSRPGSKVAAGYGAAAAAAVLWAVGGAFARHLIDAGASFVELTEARAWVTTLVLGAFGWLGRQADDPPDRVSPLLVVVFGLAIAATNYTYYASLAKLPVAVAITVQYTAPALVVAWTILIEGARPSRRVLGALALAIAGVALLAELPVVLRSGHLRMSAVGFGFAAAAAVGFSVYMITGERLGRRIGSRRAVTRGFAVASILWIVVQLARGRPHTLLDLRFVPGVLFLSIATTVAPFWLFVWGMERVRASNAGIVSTLEPVTAAMIAFVWLGQSLSAWQIAGALMVLCGVVAVQMDRPPSEDLLIERAAIE